MPVSYMEVNLSALRHNLRVIRQHLPKEVECLAVVKANAYGHGAVETLRIALEEGYTAAAVARVEEGQELRDAGFTCPIYVLGLPLPEDMPIGVNKDLILPIDDTVDLESLECIAALSRKTIEVMLPIDTGMNRIGVRSELALEYIEKVRNADYLKFEGVFTHLAAAEEPDETKKQIDKWNNVIENIDTKGLLIHIQNTAATFAYDIKSNMVRVGISLYGLYPDLPPKYNFKPKIKQVMGLKGRITNIHEVKPGEGVSYAHTFIADKPTRVATIPVGYADGVSRGLSNKIYGIINGEKIKQIGNITMDQMMFDLGDIEAQVGDVITLLDEENLTLDNWAEI